MYRISNISNICYKHAYKTGTLDLTTCREDVREPLQARNDAAAERDSLDKDFSTVDNPPLFFEEGNQNACTETIVVDSEDIVVWTWDREDLNHLDKNIRMAILAYMHQSTRQQLQIAWSSNIKDNEEKARLQQVAVNYLFGGIVTDRNSEKK